MKALIVLALLGGYFSGFAQSVPALHVIFALDQRDLDIGRLNMENDTLMTHTMRVVQDRLQCQMQIHRLSDTVFTSKALEQTIARIRATSNDIIVLYYAGYGRKSTNYFPDWQLNSADESAIPVSQVADWLRAKHAYLGLIIADCSAKGALESQSFTPVNRTRATPNVGTEPALPSRTSPAQPATMAVDRTRQIMSQLLLRNTCGITIMGTATPSAIPTQSIYFTSPFTGSIFTYSLRKALLDLLSANDPNVSFKALLNNTQTQIETTQSRPNRQPPILEIQSCSTSKPERSVATRKQISSANSAKLNWQGPGLNVDEGKYSSLPQKVPVFSGHSLPDQVDLSQYAPPVISQGDKGICVAVSIGYYMRSILEAQRIGMTDKQQILKQSFSPFYLYNQVKSIEDQNCTLGIDASDALAYIQQHGLPAFSDFANPSLCQPMAPIQAQKSSKILDYVKLFSIMDVKEDKVLAVKQTLAEASPVVVGIQTTGSIQTLSFVKTWADRLGKSVQALVTDIEQPDAKSGQAPSAVGNRPNRFVTFMRTLFTGDRQSDAQSNAWQPDQSKALEFGHALCVVGYDDNMFGNGKGAFKLINSWGSAWGDSGYFWMSYENFGCYTKYAYQAYLPPATTDNDLLDTDLTISQGSVINNALPFTMTQHNKLTTYTLTQPQRAGTPFKFKVDVKKQTYLYLITASESDSVVSRLLPPKGYKIVISPGNQLVYPSDSKVLTLSESPGQEYWLFLFSTSPIDIDSYIAAMKTMEVAFPDRVTTAFQATLAPDRFIRYKPKKMGFYLQNDPDVRERVVPLLVTMNHAP